MKEAYKDLLYNGLKGTIWTLPKYLPNKQVELWVKSNCVRYAAGSGVIYIVDNERAAFTLEGASNAGWNAYGRYNSLPYDDRISYVLRITYTDNSWKITYYTGSTTPTTKELSSFLGKQIFFSSEVNYIEGNTAFYKWITGEGYSAEDTTEEVAGPSITDVSLWDGLVIFTNDSLEDIRNRNIRDPYKYKEIQHGAYPNASFELVKTDAYKYIKVWYSDNTYRFIRTDEALKNGDLVLLECDTSAQTLYGQISFKYKDFNKTHAAQIYDIYNAKGTIDVKYNNADNECIVYYFKDGAFNRILPEIYNNQEFSDNIYFDWSDKEFKLKEE